MPLYRDLRTWLRNGQWQRVVRELEQLVTADDDNPEFRTELSYLKRHGAAGRLRYATFSELGLPVGSGAIENSIRRWFRVWRGQGTRNLRLKGKRDFLEGRERGIDASASFAGDQ